MNYEGMTDFEINKAVAEMLGYENVIEDDADIVFEGSVLADKGPWCYTFNFCRDVNDIWPMVLENGLSIGVCLLGDNWECRKNIAKHWPNGDSYFVTDILVEDVNPLRAAAICWLKLKEEEKSCE